jgi:hypothetical protein
MATNILDLLLSDPTINYLVIHAHTQSLKSCVKKCNKCTGFDDFHKSNDIATVESLWLCIHECSRRWIVGSHTHTPCYDESWQVSLWSHRSCVFELCNFFFCDPGYPAQDGDISDWTSIDSEHRHPRHRLIFMTTSSWRSTGTHGSQPEVVGEHITTQQLKQSMK